MKNCLGYKDLVINSQSVIFGVTEMRFLGSTGVYFLRCQKSLQMFFPVLKQRATAV